MTEEEAKKEIIDMANALQLIPNTPKGKAVSMALRALGQEPCEDCISRRELNNKIEMLDRRYGNDFYWEVKGIIDKLPSVYPKSKTGYWIVEVWNNKEHHTCSSCQHVVDYEPCYHYCPYCGAKMEAEE